MITITLSRRNIITMLHKLEIGHPTALLKPVGDETICLMVEHDEDHAPYNDRLPGFVRSESEDFIQEFEEWRRQRAAS